MEIRYKISSQDLYDMREAVDWRAIHLKQLEKALDNSMIVIGIYEENKIVAMGRLVGDYSCKAMLTDVIVKPEYQGKGYGKLIVTSILEKCKKNLDAGDRICIEANPTMGNREFYINCGLEFKPGGTRWRLYLVREYIKI
ncbi:MAG: GNAT family N-acetyltransferase [Erysipelotrichaceae bacterium]|nr:GNAT family N-acetyltransferase [Erysipelotrichaceae bacterium]